MRDIAIRLKTAREKVGKTPQQIAREIGLNLPSYCDLEFGHDWSHGVSLGEIFAIAKAVGLTFAELMCGDRKGDRQKISEGDLQARLKALLSDTGISTHEFEQELGWEISPVLKDANAVLGWNVDCLRAVCKRLNIDWCDFSQDHAS